MLHLFHQFKRQCDAREIDFKIPLETQRAARAAQGRAGKMPLNRVDFDDVEHAFFDKFHDMPFVDGAHAAQVLDGKERGFLEYGAGQRLIFG